MAKKTGSSIGFELELLESDADILKKIINAFAIEFHKKVGLAVVPLETAVKAIVRDALYNQPEYRSLSEQGKLAKALGLPDGHASIEWVVDRISDSVTVDMGNSGSTTSSVYVDFVIRLEVDPTYLFVEPEANIETEAGETLPWLQWLMQEGSNTIIKGYRIYYAPIGQPRSRSGGAIMIEDDGATWGVPLEFAGTETDNFVTRAMEEAQKDLDSIVASQLKKAFK